MRLAGRITDWNDEKGFGFVMPNGGGDRSFVHISAFQRGSQRPADGDLISYLPAKDARGRNNATQIRHAGQKIDVPRKSAPVPRVAVAVTTLTAVAAFAALGRCPLWLAVGYYLASIASWVMYSLDKSAAQKGGRRISENMLHLVDLAGGWPGGLIAQQQYRHKTVKQPFQQVFWATVILNVAAAVWLANSAVVSEIGASFTG